MGRDVELQFWGQKGKSKFSCAPNIGVGVVRYLKMGLKLSEKETKYQNVVIKS